MSHDPLNYLFVVPIVQAEHHLVFKVDSMDDLPFTFEPSNLPPAFYAGFARLVDGLPHSDHKSMERLTEARRLGEEKCWSPVYRYAKEIEAIDWGAVKTQLSKDGQWPQENMNQCSMEEMFTSLQASLQNSSVQSNDALPSPPWILKPGFASYKGTEIHVAGVHRKLLERLVEAKGKPVEIADLKMACDSEKMEDGSLRGYISELRNTIRRDLGLPMPTPPKKKTTYPITRTDRTYRLELL